MKKLLSISIAYFLSLTILQAQRMATGGFRRAGTNMQTKSMQRQKLKDSLGLTTEQSKKVDAIQQDFGLKIRALKLDTNIGEADRKSKLRELQAAKIAKLKQVINDEQIAKMEGQKGKPKKPFPVKKPRIKGRY